MRKLLWIGDAGCSTGFAKVTHSILDRICDRWDVGVLGINYRGDPHPYPYPIWRADRDGDQMGFERAASLVKGGTPDVVFIHQDPWWVCGYLQVIFEKVPEEERPYFVGFMPVDTKGMIRPAQAEMLSNLDFALFYTQFGVDEAVKAGLKTNTGAVYLGVDTEFFHPIDRMEARKAIGLDALVGERFLLGNVNRNQFRKRFDLTIRTFVEWLEQYGHDACLYLHANRMEMGGWNLHTLATYYGVGDRVIYPVTIDGWDGAAQDVMSSVYSSFNVQITTPLGEGWGLTQLEGLACGTIQVGPAWAALGEWMTRGSILVPCNDTQALVGMESNGVGGVVDTKLMVKVIEKLYRDPQLRQQLSAEARAYAQHPQFQWNTAAKAIQAVLLSVVGDEEVIAA